MRSLFAIWLITLLSLSSLSAVGQPAHLDHVTTSQQNPISCHPEEAFFANEGSRSLCIRFSPALAPGASVASLRMTTDEPPITVEGYWELVRNTQQAVTKMEALSETEIRQQLDELAAQWEKVTAVEFPDQKVVQIDSSYLVTELSNASPDLQRLKKLLDALLGAHAEYPQNIFTIQDIQPLQEILTRPEFQWTEPETVTAPNWLQKIIDAFAAFMERLAVYILNTLYYGRGPLSIAAVIIFIVSLYFISRNLSRNLARDAQLAADDGGDELLSSTGAMQRAQVLSKQGDYRTAIRYLYLSSLLTLDEQGLLRYDRSRTNREYLRSVASKPVLANPLRSVIDLFDRVWYGFEEVDEQTYQAYVVHVEKLRENKE